MKELPPLQGDGIVGSISAHWRAWRKYGAPRLLVQWLRNGVPIRWKTAPPRKGVEAMKQSKEMLEVLREQIQAGAFIKNPEAIPAPTFLIPKKDGTQRLIHDLRSINKHIEVPHFTLTGARSAAQVVRASNWIATLDMRHGYQQVALEPSARKYLGAWYNGETVGATVLPFGLSLSPYIFTRITNWLAGLLREKTGLYVAVYLDDSMVGANTKRELEVGLEQIRDLCEELGVVLSEEKGSGVTQRAEYLGFIWDAAAKTIGVSKERRKQYRREVNNLLRHGQTRKVWRKLIGRLLFLRQAVGPTLRHIRSLLHAVNASKGQKLVEGVGEAKMDLLWWKEQLEGTLELSISKEPATAVLTTDASDVAVGYVLDAQQRKYLDHGNEEKLEERIHTVGSAPIEDRSSHINIKELEALKKALTEYKEELSGRRVIWYTDSVTARAAIARQGSQNLKGKIWDLTKELVDFTQKQKISILPKRVPGRMNLVADGLSRPDQQYEEWQKALAQLFTEWGPVDQDPCGVTQLPTVPLESLEWASSRSLLWPRISQIAGVVELLEKVATKKRPVGIIPTWKRVAVVIVPAWKKTNWWNTLKGLAQERRSLGRLSLGALTAWEQRNTHPSEWSAFLIPMEKPGGPRKQESNMLEY